MFSNPLIGTIGATGSVASPAPSFGDIIKLDTSVINSTANIASSFGTVPTLIITTTKPGKSNVSSAATTVYPRPVNNYGNPASVTTNNVNTITEKFLDEYYRLTNLQGTINTFLSASSFWASSAPFPLQVQNGRLIAGTGTINKKGEVGPIGGIEDKLIGAKRAGATLFIAPIDNCIDITHIPKGLQVVAVSTLAQAVTLLKKPAQALAKLPALSGCSN